MQRGLWTLSICTVLGLLIFNVVNINTRPHTDLSDENIDQLYLWSDVTEYIESQKMLLSEDVMHPGYIMYDFEDTNLKRVTVKEENGQNKVYRIQTLNPASKTSKNVSIGITLEELISIYGEQYTQHRSDQVDKLIKYKDQNNGITMIFYIFQNKVDQITLEVTDFYK